MAADPDVRFSQPASDLRVEVLILSSGFDFLGEGITIRSVSPVGGCVDVALQAS